MMKSEFVQDFYIFSDHSCSLLSSKSRLKSSLNAVRRRVKFTPPLVCLAERHPQYWTLLYSTTKQQLR